jgi:hypothetical protein
MTMTKQRALEVVIELASRWGEKAEGSFSRRIQASDTDGQLAEMVRRSYGKDGTLGLASDIRNLWRAVDVLNTMLAEMA